MRYQAINNLYSTVSTQVNDKAYDDKGKLVKIDEDKVAKEVKRLQAEYEANQYQRDRKPLYPDIGDQLDDLYKKGAFSDEMAAKIKKVKDDNPKPS